MTLEDACGGGVDGGAIPDVALLPLVGVLGPRARETDDVPPARPELAAERGADARRGSRYDGDANARTVPRLMSTVSSIRTA